MDKPEHKFANPQEFRAWLEKNHQTSDGIMIIFDRKDPDCLKREAAVEEAICFGWIDGLLRRSEERRVGKEGRSRRSPHH